MTRFALTVALCASLAGCVAGDAGCATYGLQRPSMPPLSNDAAGRWVAVLDTAMTGACRK
jgi:ABC-type uncharacterized transport system auxiliary subunit